MNETTIASAMDDATSALASIATEYGYADVDANFTLGPIRQPHYFASRYACHDKADELTADAPAEEMAIVTGFGPTNAPTAGTLSVMLRAIGLQRDTGYHTTIIVSDLGAWNSRNLLWSDLASATRRYLSFLRELGFDARPEAGSLRSHRDEGMLVTSGLIAKVLQESDFKENREATDLLYDLMSLRGDWFSVMLDALYTTSDVLLPAFNGKRRVLVLAGIEEHYFTRLARVAIERLDERYPGEIVKPGVRVGALYTRLIRGLPPYPKMSKSIPASSINIGDSEDELRQKVLEHDGTHDEVLLQMIELVSDWSAAATTEARLAYERRKESREPWRQCLERYFEYYRDLSRMWSAA